MIAAGADKITTKDKKKTLDINKLGEQFSAMVQKQKDINPINAKKMQEGKFI